MTSRNIDERGMGLILRYYYPQAYVMQQDVLFRVSGPDTSGLPGITKNEKASNKIRDQLMSKPELEKTLWNKILSELTVHGFDTRSLEEDAEFDEEEDVGSRINVIVPGLVTLRLDKALNVGMCEGCGHLHYLDRIGWDTSSGQGLPPHIGCSGRSYAKYRQAPVFVPYPKDPNDAANQHAGDQLKIKPIPFIFVNCYHLKTGGFCNHPMNAKGKCVDYVAGQHSYLQSGPNYPLSGIKIVNNRCPEGLTNIKPRTLIAPRANSYTYRKTFPNNRITQRLSTMVAWEDPTSSESIENINDKIKDVKHTWFRNELVDLESTKFARMKVIDVVYGMSLGGYRWHWIKGERGENNVYGRMLNTQGFIITIKDSILEIAEGLTGFGGEEAQDKVEIIVHTLEHAIRSQLPSATGLDETKFEASYEILEEGKGARIFLFDNEVGGHGGFATLMSDADRFSRMIESVYRQTKCPIRDCNFGCEHCIFLRTCGQINRRINRRMLLDSGILQQQM